MSERERDWVDDMMDEWAEETRRLRLGLPPRGSEDFDEEDNLYWGEDIERVLLRYGLTSPAELDRARRAGWNLRLDCPLRSHRSWRTFSVDLSRGVWHCWSCGRGGGSLDLEMRIYRAQGGAQRAKKSGPKPGRKA